MPIFAAIPAIAGVAGVASSVANVVGSIAQGSAASKAAGQQQQAIGQAIKTIQPYNAFGQSVLPGYQNLLTNPQQALESLPGYQFAITQGLKAVQNSATARGLGVSGAALKGAAAYATGLADQTYGNQVGRFNEAAKLGANAAGSIANLQVGSGQAAAQGTLGQGNAIANAAGNVGNFILGNQLGLYGGAQPTPGVVYGSNDLTGLY